MGRYDDRMIGGQARINISLINRVNKRIFYYDNIWYDNILSDMIWYGMIYFMVLEHIRNYSKIYWI